MIFWGEKSKLNMHLVFFAQISTQNTLIKKTYWNFPKENLNGIKASTWNRIENKFVKACWPQNYNQQISLIELGSSDNKHRVLGAQQRARDEMAIYWICMDFFF